MKPLLALALALLPAAAAVGSPVHVALKPQAVVTADAGDFFSLAAIAALTGGDPALRARLAKVSVGRVPLAGDVRHLTRGDLALKLRQAGFQPGQDAVLEGPTEADVTAGAAPTSGGAGRVGPVSPLAPPELGAGGVILHRGDPVTIRIDDAGLSITARGIARDNGAAGDLVHVHRDGDLTDLTVTVLDAQTVQLEP